jgi:hypothetical protein
LANTVESCTDTEIDFSGKAVGANVDVAVRAGVGERDGACVGERLEGVKVGEQLGVWEGNNDGKVVGT